MQAGVDKSGAWFDRMYVYMCKGSTTPMGVFQMSGRVRTLGSDVLRVGVQRGMSLARPLARRIKVEETLT